MTRFFESNLGAVTILIGLALIAVLVLNMACTPTMRRVEWQQATYRVQSGDSLWIISGDYCPDNVDRREWIDEVQKINGLTSSFIYPGQLLTVLAPAEEVTND
jgi:nucleoid-associated protein YgaU